MQKQLSLRKEPHGFPFSVDYLTQLLSILLTVIALAPVSEALASCIPSGSEIGINAALTGAGASAVLCPGAVFNLNGPVTFTAPRQKLYTEGHPRGVTRAILRITNSTVTTAINGNNQSGIVIENVRVNGNRSELGYLKGGALVAIGGAASNQTVRHNLLFGTRSWSTIHVFEGSVINNTPKCQKSNINNNVIGPAGTPEVDKWADGISLACGNSVVAYNQIIDATDGAIVVFGAPGSLISNNTVIAATQTLLGGINMVDYDPVRGNYSSTRVTNNVIDARTAFIKVGIAMGPYVWGCPSSTKVNYGARVTNNRLQGAHFGYGYAVNGVRDWTVTGNLDIARHVGTVVAGCGGTPSQPAGYQYDSVLTSTLQSQFKKADLTWVLGVTEPPILAVIKAPSHCGYLRADQGLIPGQSLTSCDRRFALNMQHDGNLVLYNSGTRLWASNTVGKDTGQAIMQGDGNFVLHDTTGKPIWASNTDQNPGAYALLQNDGNLVVYHPSAHSLWASNTCCR